jgi:uroporphyrin-III C-methyltransferase
VSDAVEGVVYLAGAGPGDPDLLTVRTLSLLRTADVILHDDLVSEEILACASPTAQVVSVGKRYEQARTTQAEIHSMMIEAAQSGLSVVRLKSGDPLVFGRAAEEIEALRTAGVPFEVVPGVSAVFAAGAALELPLTDRTAASKLLLMTGHRSADAEDARLWDGPLPVDATLAIYMPGRSFERIARELLQAGLAPDTPCTAISRVASPEQQTVGVRLKDLGTTVPGASPVLLLVGRAMEALVNENAGRTNSTAVRIVPVGDEDDDSFDCPSMLR